MKKSPGQILLKSLSVEPFQSLETLDIHNQTHNDIKPQNFLVKFKKGYDSNDSTKNDLTQIEIALTDFGMADADSKGGTPVYASPECFEETDTKSDVFSFGRLILFLLLTKEQFMKWLYIPIKNQEKIQFRNYYFFFENYTRRIVPVVGENERIHIFLQRTESD